MYKQTSLLHLFSIYSASNVCVCVFSVVEFSYPFPLLDEIF